MVGYAARHCERYLAHSHTQRRQPISPPDVPGIGVDPNYDVLALRDRTGPAARRDRPARILFSGLTPHLTTTSIYFESGDKPDPRIENSKRRGPNCVRLGDLSELPCLDPNHNRSIFFGRELPLIESFDRA